MQITEGNFTKGQLMSREGREGLVLLGCGGDLNEWVEGVTKILVDEGIALTDTPFEEAISLTSTGGRTDLILMFGENVDVGKMAIWRLRFGDNSWLSDYVVNYVDHFAA